MRDFHITKAFERDRKRAKKRGWNLNKLVEVAGELVEGRTLAPKYQDHPLKGNWADHRDCHISGDWLLIYKLEDISTIEKEIGGILYALTERVIFVRMGTHSDLF